MLNRMMGLIPAGQGTYWTLAAGILVSWLMVLFPGMGDVMGFEGGMTAESAWQATWAAVSGMFFRRGMAKK